MKISFEFQSPDTMHYWRKEQIDDLNIAVEELGLSDDERDAKLAEIEAAYEWANETYILHGEYIQVELDSDAKTAVVVPR